MRTGEAADFWHRYEEDFERCRQMGLNAFRLSVEWPRVQPAPLLEKSSPPPFDYAALDHYAAMIASCRKYGMEPVVTLQHFTHPAWLGLDAWLDDETPAHFEQFVTVAVRHINDKLVADHGQEPITWYVTLNEPNMLVLNTYMNRHFPGGGKAGIPVGIIAYNRLLAAHVRAYNAIHDIYEESGWPDPQVTMNTFCSDVYWSEMMLLDLLVSRERGIDPKDLQTYLRKGSNTLHHAMLKAKLPFQTDPFVWLGRFIHFLVNWVAPKHAIAGAFQYFLETLAASKRSRVLDFLGLDYYDPFTGHLFGRLLLPTWSSRARASMAR